LAGFWHGCETMLYSHFSCVPTRVARARLVVSSAIFACMDGKERNSFAWVLRSLSDAMAISGIRRLSTTFAVDSATRSMYEGDLHSPRKLLIGWPAISHAAFVTAATSRCYKTPRGEQLGPQIVQLCPLYFRSTTPSVPRSSVSPSV
jgi:hypothetical protein